MDAMLAYFSEDQLTLSLLDAETMTMQEVVLPVIGREIVWQPTGDHIAMIAEDGSLWQIDYPGLQTIEPLTQPRPEVKNAAWSLDGTSLSFTNLVDIYIVDVNKGGLP